MTNREFRECLEKRKIIPFPRARKFALKELTAAGEDLAEARDRFGHRRYKYATINAYYAVFHAARALVYSKGFRERCHYCLAVALEALFVDPDLLSGRYVRMFHNTMASREEADYSGTFSKEGASLGIRDAEEFVRAASKILQPRR
ncbi:MAG: HEPN domain-containing protein [Candidatus Aminicenantes bacterium]|nr:HEPN domain-containing protein [Candidatus Aminicenantes bacterium]